MDITCSLSSASGRSRLSRIAIQAVLVLLGLATMDGMCSEMGGTITFHGAIVAPTCSVSSLSVTQNDLQALTSCSAAGMQKTVAIPAAGEAIAAMPTTLSLADSSGLSGKASLAASTGRGMLPIARQPAAVATPGVYLSFEPLSSKAKTPLGILTVDYE